jgi:hypothetical protein
VGRTYAGILGLIAFQTVVARSLLKLGGVETAMLHASLALLGFAVVGYIAGKLAELIVDDSVRATVTAEAAAQLAANARKGAPTG